MKIFIWTGGVLAAVALAAAIGWWWFSGTTPYTLALRALTKNTPPLASDTQAGIASAVFRDIRILEHRGYIIDLVTYYPGRSNEDRHRLAAIFGSPGVGPNAKDGTPIEFDVTITDSRGVITRASERTVGIQRTGGWMIGRRIGEYMLKPGVYTFTVSAKTSGMIEPDLQSNIEIYFDPGLMPRR